MHDDPNRPDEAEAVGMYFGAAVSKRWNQLYRSMPDMPGGILAAVAAYDIWMVLDSMPDGGDPSTAIDGFIEAEEVLL